jgi:hypothetical protein
MDEELPPVRQSGQLVGEGEAAAVGQRARRER